MSREEKYLFQTEPLLSLITGGIAGALSRTAVSPMERLKIILQLNNKNSISIYQNIKNMWKEEGYKGMFRGNGINCIRIIPYSAIQYSSYQQCKKMILSYKNNGNIDNIEIYKDLNVIENLFSGTIGGIMSVLFTYPMDLTKTRLSIQTFKSLDSNLNEVKANVNNINKPPGIFKSMLTIYRNEGGLLGLYRGIIPTLYGVAPYTAINFTIYQSIKNQFDRDIQMNFLFKICLGAFSGGVGQTMIYPFDILRRRFQVQTLQKDKTKHYKNVWDALRKIYKFEGGIRGLYKGYSVNLLKMMPSMAIQWTSYDIIKDLITGEYFH